MNKPGELKGGMVLAAPSSGSGKTVATLALLRLLARDGVPVSPIKLGPDYIDPAFHAVAAGRTGVNIDPWAMPAGLQRRLVPKGLWVAEAMMGLFDGAADGTASAADFAAGHGAPVVLVVDCSSMSHSVAAIVQGFVRFRADVQVAGVILNRVGSARHEAMLREALVGIGASVLAVLKRDLGLALPSRHLGLVQAGETGELEAFVDHAADLLAECFDGGLLAEIMARARPSDEGTHGPALPPPGQTIAVARDEAFTFFYQHLANDWTAAGAKLRFFSPLADEAPPTDCDVVLLPGGYPELHAGRLAGSTTFLDGLRRAAQRVPVYGECGGYMVLGEGLVDADGERHAMAGLLPLETSFAERKLHLGYRQGRIGDQSRIWPGLTFRGHEFHYSTQVSPAVGRPFASGVKDARAEGLPDAGMAKDRVAGSYLHLICGVDDE